MKTKPLLSQMRHYTNTLSVGVESTYPMVEIDDADYHPNQFIADELVDLSQPSREEAREEETVKALADATEALRRLEIIQSNVHYPVSGYRTNMTTLLKADPALEGMVHFKTTRRQLTATLENNIARTISSIVGIMLVLFSGVVAKYINKLIWRSRDKRSGADKETTYKNLVRAASAPTKLRRKQLESILKKHTPIFHKATEGKMLIVMKEFIKAWYDEAIWKTLPTSTKNLFLAHTETEKIAKLAVECTTLSTPFLVDVEKVTKDIEKVLDSKAKHDTIKIDHLGKDHARFAEAGADLTDLVGRAMGEVTVNSGTPSFVEFLNRSKVISTNLDVLSGKEFVRIKKEIDKLSSELQSMQEGIKRRKAIDPDTLNTSVGTIQVLSKASQQVRNIFQVVSNIYNSSEAIDKMLVNLDKEMKIPV